MKIGHLSGLVVAAAVLAGCAQAPTADVDAAKRALDDARTAQAPDYAPQAWNAAQDAATRLDVELEAQQQKWSALRSYTVAKQLAQDAKTAADSSKDAAVAGKEQAKTDASTLMAQARDEASKAHAAIASAPRGKGTEADLTSLRSDATSIDESLQEMQRVFDAGDYLAAKTKAQATIDAAKKIQAEIDQAKSARRAA